MPTTTGFQLSIVVYISFSTHFVNKLGHSGDTEIHVLGQISDCGTTIVNQMSNNALFHHCAFGAFTDLLQ